MKRHCRELLQFCVKKSIICAIITALLCETEIDRKKRAGEMRNSNTVASVLSWRYITNKLQIFLILPPQISQ